MYRANTAGLPDHFHADAIVSSGTAVFRVDLPTSGRPQTARESQAESVVVVTLICGLYDQNILPSSEGPTPAEGDARPAAYRQYSHTYVDYWSSSEGRWISVLPGARGVGPGWYSHRAFKAPIQVDHSHPLPYVKLRFKGGSFGAMHGTHRAIQALRPSH
jgi:hypothetical protein